MQLSGYDTVKAGYVERLNPFQDSNGISELAKMTHRKRYELARGVVSGHVLDAACGMGYGSSIMAENALVNSVTGIDISKDALLYAKHHYILGMPRNEGRINFLQGDCKKLHLQFAPHKFNWVVSFETIEHLENPQEFLEGVHYALNKDGTFIVSTPLRENSRTSTDGNPQNPFHVREFTYDEMLGLLSGTGFSVRDIYFQELFLGSCARLINHDAENSPQSGGREGNGMKGMLKKAFNSVRILPEMFSEPYQCPPGIGRTGMIGIYVAKPESLRKYA